MGNCLWSASVDNANSSNVNVDQKVKSDTEKNRLLPGHTTQQSYGTHEQSASQPKQQSQQKRLSGTLSASTTGPTPIKSSAKPIGQFGFLDRKYSVTIPECGIPDIDEVFKNVCERYDIAVINREKIDEALILFKQILDLELDTPLEECFKAWKEFLVNPRFTVNCMEATGDVKDIRVRADDIPKEKRKAQKHIRDLLDACHLFLQQREFLQRNIVEDLTKLDEMSMNLVSLAEGANLSSSKKKHLNKNFSAGQALVSEFPTTIELFWRQTYSLMHEINTSVHILDGVPGPDSADLR